MTPRRRMYRAGISRPAKGVADAAVLSGRLLVAALGNLDRAEAAERQVMRMAFLSDLENRLLGSLETGRMRETVAQVVLPEVDSWTVVDVLEAEGPSRWSLVHPESGIPSFSTS